jgi:hypothetical protein
MISVVAATVSVEIKYERKLLCSPRCIRTLGVSRRLEMTKHCGRIHFDDGIEEAVMFFAASASRTVYVVPEAGNTPLYWNFHQGA